MSKVTFSEIRERLKFALQEKLDQISVPEEDQGYDLIDGFMSLSVRNDISGNILLSLKGDGSGNIGIKNPHIPTVGVVGRTTGFIHTFALKVVLPDIEI